MDPRIDLTEDRMFRNDGEPIRQASYGEVDKYEENYKLLNYANAMLELFGVPINIRYPGIEYSDSDNLYNKYFERIRINYDLVPISLDHKRELEDLRYELYYELLLDEKNIIHKLDDKSKDIYVTYRVIKDIANGYINRRTMEEESYYEQAYDELKKLVSEPLFGEPETINDTDTEEWFKQLVFYDPLEGLKRQFTEVSNAAVSFRLKKHKSSLSKTSYAYDIIYDISNDYIGDMSKSAYYFYNTDSGKYETSSWNNINDNFGYVNTTCIDIDAYVKKLIFYDNHVKIKDFANADFSKLLNYESTPEKNPNILPLYRAIDFDFDEEELRPLRIRAGENTFIIRNLTSTVQISTAALTWTDF